MLMGFSCGGDYDIKENHVPLREEGLMENSHLWIENDCEFRPVEHPLEPADEDRPVKCPMPHSSVIKDGRVFENRSSENFRKRNEFSATLMENETMMVMDLEPPVRSPRKRHHPLSNGGDNRITPLLTTRPPAPAPSPAQSSSIFQMLQQLDKF